MSLLPDTVARVDEAVGRAQATGRVPALVAGVVRDGELVHISAAGQAPRDGGVQYRLGSISKTLTAALVLALRDEGLLALDDLLYRHLPGTPVGGVTLRQLLGHVGGMQREPDGPWWERATGTDVDTFLAELTPDKVAYPPLHRYHYSNLAYGLLGAVVTRLTGDDWPTLLDKRVLSPLGMRRTTYHPAEPFARGYVVHPYHGTLREEPRLDTGAMAPAGQLWSTVADLSRWAAFLAEPDPDVLDPGTVTEMCTPVVMSDPDAWTAGLGLGVMLWRRGERVFVGHAGSMPGYLAILAVHRPSSTAVVAFANAYTLNHTTITDLGLDLLTAVLDREPARPEPWRPTGTPPPAEAEPLTGRWWSMGREYVAEWDSGRRELVVTPITVPDAPWRFTPDGTDRWRGCAGMNDGEALRVRRVRSGAVSALDIATAVFTREP